MQDLSLLPTSTIINPFLSMPLELIKFGSPNVQGTQIFLDGFGNQAYLTPGTQGIHLPTAIYDYLDEHFFQQLCKEVPNFSVFNDSNTFTLSQTYLALDQCQCKGRDYSGMPSLSLQVDESDEEEYYEFSPSQFELFPKVNKVLRTTFCNLGLWNLEDQYPNID